MKLYASKVTLIMRTGCPDVRLHEENMKRLLARAGVSEGTINSVRCEIIEEGDTPAPLSDHVSRAALALIKHGDRIEAIALIRGATGCGLDTAKAYLVRLAYSG